MAIRRSREDGLPETRLRHDFSSSPVLIYGASIARGNGWKEAVAFAEALDLLTAFQNKTPLIMTSGQQTREMLLMEPWLTNVEPTILPRPWVKWAYEPCGPRTYRPRSCVRLRPLFSRLLGRYSFRFRSTIGKSLAQARPWCGQSVRELPQIPLSDHDRAPPAGFFAGGLAYHARLLSRSNTCGNDGSR